jgi:multiple sugar transport system substrate-binding protein
MTSFAVRTPNEVLNRWFAAILLVLSLSGGFCAGNAWGQVFGINAEERAVNGAKAFMGRQSQKSVELTVVIPKPYAKDLVEKFEEFEKKTGIAVKTLIEIDEGEILPRLRTERTSRAGRVDLFLAPPLAITESAEALLPLDDFIRAGRPDLHRIPDGFRRQGLHLGKRYGVFANGKILVLAIRRDLTALDLERNAFKKKFRWAPACPDTWKQWQELSRFYTRTSENGEFPKYYGAMASRSLGQGWRWWLQRFYSKGMLLFDEAMNPTLESPEGIETTAEYAAITKYMPLETLTWAPKNGISTFLRGNVFSMLTYPSSVHPIQHATQSKVAGKVRFCSVPGSLVAGGPFLRAIQVGGVLWVVNRYGRNPQAAYWLVQWLTSSRISSEMTDRLGSAFSPHRIDHFWNPKIRVRYTRELIQVIEKLTQVVVPELNLLNADKYREVLARNLFNAVNGSVTPEDAMKQTTNEWQELTNKIGRRRQMKTWNGFLKGLPNRDFPE